jgi:anti-sigma factor RsiW
MNCLRDLIEAYVDEVLAPSLRAAVQEHLSECGACSELDARFREQRATIRLGAPYFKASARLKRSVVDALRRRDGK